MREVEVKVKISNLKEAKEILEEKGVVFDEETIQEDKVFLKQGISYEDLQVKANGANVLRLREQDGQVKFTLKQTQSMELDCLEAETLVEDPIEMQKAIELLGFYLAVRVKKVRQKGKLNGLTFCLDEVEELGSFVEVEKLCEDNIDAENVQKELYQILVDMGLEIEKQMFQGYDTLMYFKLKQN